MDCNMPCSLSLGVGSNSCPLSRWCHLTISFSATCFSFCLQSFPATRSFPMSWLFASSGQSIGATAFNINPSNEYSGLISFRTDYKRILLQIEDPARIRILSMQILNIFQGRATNISDHLAYARHTFNIISFDTSNYKWDRYYSNSSRLVKENNTAPQG